jgi:taurine dioxygenase
MSVMIGPLSDALGAEVVGLDASRPLGGADFARIHQAHLDYHVLVFRDQHLTPQQQIDFSRHFGPLDEHLAGYPE